jgi:acyl carrier protein
MKMADTAPTPQQTAEIRQWLIERIAYYLEKPADDIDPSVPLAESGIDSVSATSLCGDVEERFDINADPTMVFDYPTVADIAGFIWSETSAQQ